MRVKFLVGLWMAPLLAVVTLGAVGREAPLVEAVKSEDPAVAALLKKGVDVNAPEADGTTALHWAVHHDDLKTTDLLIRAGANVKATNRYGVTPLSLASENGNVAIIERLLAAGADPNSGGPEGETALMTAARTGRSDAVKMLLIHGAEVNATEHWRGQTALMWAAVENNAAAAQTLIEGGAKVKVRSKGGFTPLLFAARGGNIAAAQVLLAAGASANETLPDGESALVLAAANGNYEFAAWLLEKGADPNASAQGWTALHEVAWTRRPNIGQIPTEGPLPRGALDSLSLVKQLVAHGANPNAQEQKEPRDGYRNLLNRIGATPFMLAAKAGDTDLMRVLVANGADPLQPTVDRVTPLMAAAGVGLWAVGESPGTNEEALEAVKLALELGGDVNAVSAHGYTAMHGAAHRGSPAIVQLLADRGAKLDMALTKTGGGELGWHQGWTPLAIAEGLFYANTLKRQPETATLIRKLMAERGLSTDQRASTNDGTVPTTTESPR